MVGQRTIILRNAPFKTSGRGWEDGSVGEVLAAQAGTQVEAELSDVCP